MYIFLDEEESRHRQIESINQMYLKLTLDMKKECLREASLNEIKALEIIVDAKNWKQLSSNPLITYNDKINSYYIRREFNCSVKGLFDASWKDNVIWNNQVKSANVLNPLDASTELVRIISQPAMNGYIASRFGFLNLRSIKIYHNYREFIDVRKVSYNKDTNTYFCTYSSIGPTISQKVPLIDGLVRYFIRFWNINYHFAML